MLRYYISYACYFLIKAEVMNKKIETEGINQ